MLVLMTADAEAEFEELNEEIGARVRDIFTRLENWPEVSGVKHLHYDWEGFARVRTGKWRVIFKVEGDVVMIVRIEKRDDVYKKR